MPSNFFYNQKFVDVGRQQFWIFGGKAYTFPDCDHSDSEHTSYYFFYTADLSDEPRIKSLIWNARKEVYYPGPNLPIGNVQLFVNLIFTLYARCRFKKGMEPLNFGDIILCQIHYSDLMVTKFFVGIGGENSIHEMILCSIHE